MSAFEHLAVHGDEHCGCAARLRKRVDQCVDLERFTGGAGGADRLAEGGVHVERERAVLERRGLHLDALGQRACGDERIYERLVGVVLRVCAGRRECFTLFIRNVDRDRLRAARIGVFRLYGRFIGLGIGRFAGIAVVRRFRRGRVLRLGNSRLSGSSVGLLRTYPYTQAAATTAMIAITAIITFERFIVNASFLLQAYCTKPDGKIQGIYC